jgi:hypothetical protein
VAPAGETETCGPAACQVELWQLQALTVKQLRLVCKDKGLSSIGKKATLVDRIGQLLPPSKEAGFAQPEIVPVKSQEAEVVQAPLQSSLDTNELQPSEENQKEKSQKYTKGTKRKRTKKEKTKDKKGKDKKQQRGKIKRKDQKQNKKMKKHHKIDSEVEQGDGLAEEQQKAAIKAFKVRISRICSNIFQDLCSFLHIGLSKGFHSKRHNHGFSHVKDRFKVLVQALERFIKDLFQGFLFFTLFQFIFSCLQNISKGAVSTSVTCLFNASKIC